MATHRRLSYLRGLTVLAVLALVTPPILRTGDLLALPAVALVLIVWLAITILIGLRLVTMDLLIPGVTVGRRLGRLAWQGMAQDPLIRGLAGRWSPIRRRLEPIEPVLRRIAPWLRLDARGIGRTTMLAAAVSAVILLWRVYRLISILTFPAVGFDQRFADMAQRLSVPAERAVMVALSAGARPVPMTLAVVAVATGALIARSKRGALIVVSTSALSALIVEVLKTVVHRARPPFGQAVVGSFSWPSGHAAASLALALGLCLFVWHVDRRRWSTVAMFVVPWALLVGYSRAYLTVHWASDVVAGWLVAIMAAAIIATIDLSLHRPRQAVRPGPLYAGLATGAIAILAFALFGPSLPSQPAYLLAATRVTTTDPSEALRGADLFSVTLLGRPMEPTGLIVVGTEKNLRAAVGSAGWNIADKNTLPRLLKTTGAAIAKGQDPTAPVTPSFLGTRMQDLAIEKPVSGAGSGIRARHHARFWRLPIILGDGCPVWVATASTDDRVEWNVRTLFPTHHINPAIDVERDLIADQFAATGFLVRSSLFRVAPPTLGSNAAGDPFFTDGNAAILRQAGACSPSR